MNIYLWIGVAIVVGLVYWGLVKIARHMSK